MSADAAIEAALAAAGVENAPRPRHLGALPPGLPRGIIEDCYDCGVYWYTRPDRAGGYVVRWAAVLLRQRVAGDPVWRIGENCVSELPTREEARRIGSAAALAEHLRVTTQRG